MAKSKEVRDTSKHYLVTWEIDIWADSPAAAAEIARDCQTDPNTTATIFKVQRADGVQLFDLSKKLSGRNYVR